MSKESDDEKSKKDEEKIENQEDYDESAIRKLRIKGKDNKIYSFEIIKEQNQKIIFQAMFEDSKDVVYEKKLTHSDFIKIDGIYKKFDDIEELYSLYLIQCEESKIILNLENNKVILTLFIHFSTKEYETKFALSPKKASVDSMINNINESLQEIKQENEMLKKEVETSKNEINELKNTIQELESIKKISNNNTNDINEMKTNFEIIEKLKKELKTQKDYYNKTIEEMKSIIQEQKSEIENMKKKCENQNTGKEALEKKIIKNTEDTKYTNERLTKYLNDVNTLQNINKALLDQSNTFVEQQSNLLKAHVEFNKEKMKNFEKQFIELKEDIKNCTKEKTYNLGRIMDKPSDIIKYDELILIEEGVKQKLKKNIKGYKLLFKASINGYRVKDFHSICDGKSYTVTLVKTNIGRRFGGFTDQSWDQSNSYKSGSNGFLFSLDFKEIYYNKNSSYNIYPHSSYGPYFGSGDFYIGDNCNTGYNSSDSSNNSYNTFSKNYALAGNSNFIVEDYEVYQLTFE